MDVIYFTPFMRAIVKFLTAFVLLVSSTFLNGYDVLIRSSEGDLEFLEVVHEADVEDIFDSLEGNFPGQNICFIDFSMFRFGNISRKAVVARDYHTPLSSAEKNDLRYIINTLGMASLAKIAKERSSLKKAGDRIDNIHPFHFLSGIFLDEEMKTSVHALRNRGWVWGGFYEGISTSLEEESKKNNLEQFIPDFANKLKLDPALISSAVAQENWKELVNILIDKIPRSKNNDRYRM